jgi:hypothetical protein
VIAGFWRDHNVATDGTTNVAAEHLGSPHQKPKLLKVLEIFGGFSR